MASLAGPPGAISHHNQKGFDMKKNFVAAVALSLTSGFALAAESTAVSSAVAAITAAQGDALAVAVGLTTMGVAVWGAMYLYRKFFR